VLTVAVHLNRDVEASFPRVLVPRLDGAADAEVERQPDDVRSSGRRETRGLVHRAVVDDHDLELGVEGADLGDDLLDGGALVVGGDDRDAAKADEPRVRRRRGLRAR
jgi:hypothetical protein